MRPFLLFDHDGVLVDSERWYFAATRTALGRGDRAIAIEDSSRGPRSALAAGLDCIVIRTEFTASQDFSGAWRVIHSIRELPQALCG